MICASCASSSRGRGPAPPVPDQYEPIAELYDGYPGNYLEDVVFYAEEGKRAGSPVLEIGVGTGRLALCLASVGVDVGGLDSSSAMLRQLVRKREAFPELPGRVWALAADMRGFALRQRFPLAIVAFRTFLYSLTRAEQRRTLRAIRRHLLPGGRLAMSFFVPPAEMLARGRTERNEMARFPAPGGEGEVVAYDWAEFLPRQRRVVSHITYEWRGRNGRRRQRREHRLVARYLFPEEVRPLLESCGYRVVEAYGSFDRRRLTCDSREQIWLAEPAAKKRGR
jgi:SAM-dependent methyltransferase